jgi:hypothetical protein
MTDPMMTSTSILDAAGYRARTWVSGWIVLMLGADAVAAAAAVTFLPPLPSELILAARALLLF